MRDADLYWKQRITWYPDGCFGPYRSAADGYSRREIAADAAVHALGVACGLLLVVGWIAAQEARLRRATEGRLRWKASCF